MYVLLFLAPGVALPASTCSSEIYFFPNLDFSILPCRLFIKARCGGRCVEDREVGKHASYRHLTLLELTSSFPLKTTLTASRPALQTF